MKYFLIFLFFPLIVNAQAKISGSVAFKGAAAIQGTLTSGGGGGGGFTPTNLPGTSLTPVAWFVSGDYTTNAGTATLTSRYGSAVLTNATAASTPIGNSGGLHFAGSQWLDNLTINQSQPFTIMTITAFTNGSGTKALWAATAPYQSFGLDTLGINGGSSGKDFIPLVLTNKYMAVTALFDAANTDTWTNNVNGTGAGPSQGTSAWANTTLGSLPNHTFNGSFTILEWVLYSGGATSTDRSNFVYYATNTYPTFITWP